MNFPFDNNRNYFTDPPGLGDAPRPNRFPSEWSADRRVVEGLTENLAAKGVDGLRDEVELRPGDLWPTEFEDALGFLPLPSRQYAGQASLHREMNHS